MPTRPVVPADLVYDPYDAEIDQNPYGIWKRLRDEAPLYYNEKYDFYALSRYEDVQKGLQNWQDYSSARGTLIELIKTGPEVEGTGMFAEGNIGMMIFTDPPGHDIARRLVQGYFSPKAIQAFEGRCRTLVRHFLDQVEGQSEFDLAEDIIRPIPPMMVGHILGVPEEDQARLGQLVDASLAYDPEKGPAEIKDGVRVGNEHHMAIAQYIVGLVAERTANPKDDLVTMLINAEVETTEGGTRRLDVQEVISFFMLLYSAGSETTARALSWAGVLLSRHPEQRQKLLDDPGKIMNAVEELIRYEPPTPIQARYVTRDVEWYGVTVPKDSRIAFLNGSAGRDERQYENPDMFDVDRKTPLRHLSFGFGTHICLGASLARLEMRVVIDELLKRYPSWHVDESKVKLVHTTTVRGPATVPVTV